MKKEYRTPTIKVRTIQCPHILCLSGGGDTLGITYDEVSTEENEFSDYVGYDKAW